VVSGKTAMASAPRIADTAMINVRRSKIKAERCEV
jgi:hypothetical protein